MHQMRSLFSDAQVEKLKESSDEIQTECHETEPNPSKDSGKPEGDNPSL
jgi:hypothetical protein